MHSTYCKTTSLKWLTPGLLGILIGTSSVSQAETNYYVSPNGDDRNPGTLDAPFASLNAASRRVHPSDRVYIRGGTYYWNQRQVLKGGTAASPVLYIAYEKERPAFDASGITTKEDAISLTSGLLLSGLEVFNSNKNCCCLWHGSDVRVSYCKFHDCMESGFLASYSQPNGVANVTIDHCQVYHTCLKNNPPGVRNNWPPAVCADGAVNFKVEACVVDHNFGEGIGLDRCIGSEVRHNRVFDNWSVNIYLDNGVDCSVNGNLVYTQGDLAFYRGHEPAAGIQMAVEPATNGFPATGLKRIAIRDNMISDCKYGLAYGSYGLGGGIQDLRVENNTVSGATKAILHFADDSSHSGLSFSKNIFVQLNSKPITDTPGIRGYRATQNVWFGGDPGKLLGREDVIADPGLPTSRPRETAHFQASFITAASRAIGARSEGLGDVPREPAARPEITKAGGS